MVGSSSVASFPSKLNKNLGQQMALLGYPPKWLSLLLSLKTKSVADLGFVFLKSFHTLNCFPPYTPQSPKLGFIVSSVNLVREYLCKGPFFVFEEFIVAAKKLNIN